MSSTGLKPWVRDAFELIKHAEEHAQAGSDFDRRMAMISFDNAIELSIITYFSLHPDQRDGQKFKEKNLAQWGQGFHGKLKFFKHYVEDILGQLMQVEFDDMTYYHRVRNELYHSGIGMVPAETDINGIRTAALWVFSTLFKVDVEPLLTLDPPSDNSPAIESRTTNESVKRDESKISETTEFLRLFILMRNDLNLLMQTVGVTEYKPSAIAELEEYRDVIQRAEALRNEIVDDPNQEPGAARVKELSKELQYIHHLIEVRLQNHQREIATKAIEATSRAATKRGYRRAGIIWQSPGTGMTLSILSYVEKALSLEVLNNPLIIVASELNLIVDQTYHMLTTMAGSFRSLVDRGVRSELLVDALRSRDNRVVFTTIQRLFKLRSQGPFNRDNLIFVGQDIHLSSGIISHALFDLFPNAIFIFFTSSGPPTEGMKALYGDLITTYDFRRALEDKVIYPIDFEQRNIRTNDLAFGTLEDFPEAFAHFETAEYARTLAEDLVSHFQIRNTHVKGKALAITSDLRFADALVSNLNSIMQPDTEIATMSSALSVQSREDLISRFFDSQDKLKIAVISRGFKPIPRSIALKTIYLTGSFSRNYIARVIGVLSSHDGPRGLLVDYGKNLQTVMSILDRKDEEVR
jgi:SWI2/SNF2 ATPase